MTATVHAGRLFLVATSMVLAVATGLGAPAGAVVVPGPASTTFGSNLAAPDVSFGCDVEPTIGGLIPSGASQCTWTELASGTSSAVGSDLIPQGSGTVTVARVRVGPTTGPMRFVMIRDLVNVNNLNESCCVVLLESKTFTPERNAVTTETVNFPIVDNGSVHQDIEIVDVLGLLVHSARTPVPLTNETSRPLNLQPADAALFGPPDPGVAQLFFDPDGYQLQIQGRYQPD